MLVATLGKMPLFLLCSLSLSGSSSSPVLGEAMPLSMQSPDQHMEKKEDTLFLSLDENPTFPNMSGWLVHI